MYRFLVLIVLLFTGNLSWGQTPADLVRDVRENTNSVTVFLDALQKHANYRDTINCLWYDAQPLLAYNSYKEDYR